MKRIVTILLVAMSALPASASPMATRQWTSNYVAQAVASSSPASIITTLINSGIVSPGGGSSAESVFAPSNGIATVSFAVVDTNGAPSIVERQYAVSIGMEISPPFHGARIVSSALPECPTGTLYACVAPGVLAASSLTGGVSRLAFEKSGGEWFVYTLEGDAFEWRSMNRGDRIQISKWELTNGVSRLIGTFSIVPHSLTAEEFAAAAPQGAESSTHEWCSAATNQTAAVVFTWTPVAAGEPAAPVLRSPRLRAAAPNRGAGASVPVTYHGPGAIDWNATYNPPDGKHYEPGEDIPMGAWEDPSNWTPNFPITVQFEDVDQYGNPMTSTATIPNESMWNILVNNGKIVIPPWPHVYPHLVDDKKTCEEYGHLWGKHCVCEACGIQRAHKFEFKDPYRCAVCVNKLCELKSEDGELRAVPTDEECGDNDKPMTDIGNHAGWHHEGPDDNEAIFFCTCQCKAVGPDGVALAHDLTHKRYEQMGGEEGRFQHYDVKVCQREGCEREVYVKETHSVGSQGEDIDKLRYYNETYHWVDGTCPQCEGTVQGVLMPHLWGFYGDDPEHYCKCPCFPPFDAQPDWVPTGDEPDYSLHVRSLIYWVNNNGKMPPKATTTEPAEGTRFCIGTPCSRCGGALGGTDMYGLWKLATEAEDALAGHRWSYPDRGDGKASERHWCACGAYPDSHVFVRDPTSGKEYCDHGTPLLTPGCGIERGEAETDRRDGSDSTNTDPDPDPDWPPWVEKYIPDPPEPRRRQDPFTPFPYSWPPLPFPNPPYPKPLPPAPLPIDDADPPQFLDLGPDVPGETVDANSHWNAPPTDVSSQLPPKVVFPPDFWD